MGRQRDDEPSSASRRASGEPRPISANPVEAGLLARGSSRSVVPSRCLVHQWRLLRQRARRLQLRGQLRTGRVRDAPDSLFAPDPKGLEHLERALAKRRRTTPSSKGCPQHATRPHLILLRQLWALPHIVSIWSGPRPVVARGNREPGVNPGLSRSGMGERRSLVREDSTGAKPGSRDPRPAEARHRPRVRRPARGPSRPARRTAHLRA